MLNTKFFTLVSTNQHNDTTYYAYKPNNHSMVLYSQIDGTPLASVALKYRNNWLNSTESCIITKIQDKDDQQRFQGIVSKDNQEIAFVITNLCSEGMLDINLMKSNIKVKEVNPGGLNQVNELRPYESYEIQADQTRGNRSIIISYAKDKENNKVTLAEETEKTTEEKVGDYLYISVLPQVTISSLATKFKKTVWKSSDDFIIVSKTYKHTFDPESSKSDLSFNEPTLGLGGGETASFSFGDCSRRGLSRSASMPVSTGSAFSFGASSPGIGRSASLFSSGASQTMATPFSFASAPMPASTGQAFSFGASAPAKSMSMSDDNFMPSVMNSHVGKLKHGEQVIVNSSETGLEYNYDLISPIATFNISVLENMVLLPGTTKEVMKSNIEKYIKLITDKEDVKLINDINKLYTAETCCVCLESIPDMVFYKCGHVCTDKECSKELKECPYCRSTIYYKIEKNSISA